MTFHIRPSRLLRVALFAPALLTGARLASAESTLANVAGGPSVRDVVEFTRLVQPSNFNACALQQWTSPNGRRAFVVTRRAEVDSDSNYFNILLLDLEPSRLEAGRPRSQEVLLSVASNRDNYYLHPSLSDVAWVDDGTIVFRARMDNGPFQVYSLNIATRRVTQLTRSDRPILSFSVSRDLRRVVHVSLLENPFVPAGARAGVVANSPTYHVLFPSTEDRLYEVRRVQYFVSDSQSGDGPRALGEPFTMQADPPHMIVDASGSWALLKFPETNPEPLRRWAARYPDVAQNLRRYNPTDRDPLRYFSRGDSAFAMRVFLYDLRTGERREVLEAPTDVLAGSYVPRPDLTWLSHSRSFVIAGMHVPEQSGAKNSGSIGSHILEYWPESGQWTVIAAIKGGFALQGLYSARDGQDAFVVVDEGRARRFRRNDSGRWVEDRRSSAQRCSDQTWSLSIEQGLNTPPDVFAVSATGQRVRLTHLNPQFSGTTWGVVRAYSWTDRKGRRWDGGLIARGPLELETLTPVGRRLPLVVQTYGFSPDKFYLDGSNVGPGLSSGFPGRAFVRHGIIVLALPWRPTGWTSTQPGTAGEAEAQAAFIDGVRGAVDSLVAQGVVDPDRIGIIGFSSTGEGVLRLLTFGDVPMRAASIIDGDNGSLFGYVATYGHSLTYWLMRESVGGGTPFGDGLERWLRNDPSLKLHCVTAALRIEGYGRYIHPHWDTYALLRAQYKPVEMIVFPEGRHSLSRPSERMISLQGNVDWYRFWLSGEERAEAVIPGETEASLADQYKRWWQMVEMKVADDKKPRCARATASE